MKEAKTYGAVLEGRLITAIIGVAAWLTCCAGQVGLAEGTGASCRVLIDVFDSGGLSVSCTSVRVSSSMGGIVGSPTDSGCVVLKQGYAGQLSDMASLVVLFAPNPVDETSLTELSGRGVLDDASAVTLQGQEIAWQKPAYPLSGITPSGMATAAVVYADTTGVVTGACGDVVGYGEVQVLDSISDNYGVYAGDGLPDDWQVGHFGENYGEGGPTNNPDGDVHNNEEEYIADTDPTDSNDYFRIIGVAGTTSTMVRFVSSSNRFYSMAACTSLYDDWTPVSGVGTQQGTGGTNALTDTNSPPEGRFYRLSVSTGP